MLKDLKSLPEWKEACLRYRYDITRFAVEGLNMTKESGQAVTWQQQLLFLSVARDGSRTSVASGHGTGKTRSAGIIALWHLLFFPDSVMMFTAPQIDQLRKLVWKEIAICLGRLKTTHLAWLADYVTILAESVYIKGHDKTWHVVAKTAPKNQPTNLAGQHGDNYFLWGDEACGIDDAIMDVAMGALTHKNNRACLTSQPARSSGFFFNTHHKLSVKAGGVWTALTFNGEQSPIVSIQKLKESLKQYGSRDDPQYMIRIRGIFPDRANEFLITQSMASSMYDKRKAIKKKKHKDYGYVCSVDVGGGIGRDDSVITIARVWGQAQYGDYARRVDVIDIPLCNNRADVHAMTACIEESLLRYPNLTILLDANGAGIGLAQNLRSLGIYFREIHWGGECFENANKKLYVNRRSQANVCLARAVAQGRIKIHTNRYRAKLEEQVTRIPYVFDEKSRYKVLSKEEMKRRGHSSPDMIDTLAFIFMENINITTAYDDEERQYQEEAKKRKKAANAETEDQEEQAPVKGVVDTLKDLADDID